MTAAAPSIAQGWADLDPADRSAVIDAMSDGEVAAALSDWRVWARPEQLTPPGDWRVWLILAGRGWGKALYLGMEIPTVDGWKTMADLRVGDRVFDEDGQPCNVTFATEVMIGHPCYEVEFDDGTVVTADADHEWLTWSKSARKAASRRILVPSERHGRPQCAPRAFPAIVTTSRIAATLLHGKECNHSIPTCGPVAYPERHLPIPPYTFGAWLGDGDSNGAVLTSADPGVLEEIRRDGFRIVPHAVGSRTPRYGIGGDDLVRDPANGRMVANDSLHSTLKATGLAFNKHIPRAYLESSPSQRTALLHGLMDTDGSVEPCGRCEFVTVRRPFADDVMELVRSLGFKPVLAEDRAKIDGRDCGPRYRIRFTPHAPVFRLARKLERQHSGKTQRLRVKRRFIVDVRPVPSVAVRCIQVDSPSHLFLCSRSFIPTHNTLTGAEDVKAFGLANPGSRIAILAPTYADARDTCVEGESGLLSRLDPDAVEAWNRSLGELTLTNGSRFKLFSSDEPDRLRGPQHHRAWIDELCAFRYAQAAFDMLMFGLRLGDDPQVVITTTPKPAPIVRDLLKRVGRDVHLTRGRTGDNRENLAPAFLDQIVARYSGTRIARQELEGEVLEDVEGALWTLDGIDATRLVSLPDGVKLDQVVVAVDPSGGDGAGNDEQGIVVAARGSDKRGYVLADRSCKLSPDGWGRRAVQSYLDFSADAIVFESNFGGDMVAATIRTAAQAMAAEGLPTLSVPTRKVTASRGKRVRAEPVAALYEQGRISHVGSLPKLEDQMTGWTPGMASPDRLDAMVWALTELILGDLGSFAPLDF